MPDRKIYNWQESQVKLIDNGDSSFALAVQGTKGSKSAPTAVSVASTATSILAANTSRKAAFIANNGTQTVYLGRDNTVTTANGLPLAAGQTWPDDTSTDAWYGIVASGTCDVRFLEVA